MNIKALILGKGYIASRLHKEFGWPICDTKILSYQDALGIYKKYQPRIIVNCIGHVGKRNVDDCELHVDECLSSNTMVPIWLGEIAYRNPVKLVHISSGCIFHYDHSKQKPLTEEFLPDYYNLFYSRTKIYSEGLLNELSKRSNVLIVRIRVPMDIYPNPRNILTKLIKFKTIIDTPNAITYIPDFIKALDHLIKIDARGLYNVVNKGGMRYPELMDVYKKHVPSYKYKIITLKSLKLDRTNLILSVNKLEKTGFAVRKIKEVLNECVEQYVRY